MNDLIERGKTSEEIDKHLAFVLKTYNERYGNPDNEYISGYKKAHEHIKEVITLKVPSAQPEKRTEERTETHACDLISRQEAIEVLAKFVPYAICDASTESYTNGLTDAYNLICQLPSAQPEEDCDTCKHGYFMDAQCERCRVRYPSHYEREVKHHGSD